MSDDAAGGTSLTSTLTLALAQCQERDRMFQEQRDVIATLQQENRRLRDDLEDERTKARHAQRHEATPTQLEQLFQRTIEQQSEITYLRTKLKAIKTKAKSRGFEELVSSSPGVVTVNNTGTPERPSAKRGSSEQENKTSFRSDREPTSRFLDKDRATPPPKKRQRTSSPNKISHGKRKPGKETAEKASLVKYGTKAEGTAIAVPSVTVGDERGSEHGVFATAKHKIHEQVPGTYERLEDLLSGPAPASPLVPRASRVSLHPDRDVGGGPTHESEDVAEAESQLELATGEHARAARATRLLMTDGEVISTPRAAVRNVSLIKLGTNKTNPMTTGKNPENNEPLRIRPVDRLNLTHFKVNPRFNGGLDYAYNEVVRSREARKCLPGCTRPECCGAGFRALAATLPSLPGIQTMSDNELLKEYLGPGTEEKIKTLTRAARENLLHEARTKLLADRFGKMHRNAYERQKSPVGFWGTDMPTSQEKESSKEIARSRQREEVKQRYLEALKENGRWMFADE